MVSRQLTWSSHEYEGCFADRGEEDSEDRALFAGFMSSDMTLDVSDEQIDTVPSTRATHSLCVLCVYCVRIVYAHLGAIKFAAVVVKPMGTTLNVLTTIGGVLHQ